MCVGNPAVREAICKYVFSSASRQLHVLRGNNPYTFHCVNLEPVTVSKILDQSLKLPAPTSKGFKTLSQKTKENLLSQMKLVAVKENSAVVNDS
jgi:hypothetical protein